MWLLKLQGRNEPPTGLPRGNECVCEDGTGWRLLSIVVVLRVVVRGTEWGESQLVDTEKFACTRGGVRLSLRTASRMYTTTTTSCTSWTVGSYPSLHACSLFQCPTVSLARRRKMERKSVQKSWETLRSGARAVISPFSSSSFSTNHRYSVTKQFSSLVGRFTCLYKLKTSIQIARGAHSHTQTHHLAPLATNKNYRVWTLKHVNYHLRVDETTYRNKRDDHKEKKGRLFNINHAISVSSKYSPTNKERIRLRIKKDLAKNAKNVFF